MFSNLKNLVASLFCVLSALSLSTEAHATTTITKSQREALVFIANLSKGNAAQQAFFDFVEFSAQGIAQINLNPNYHAVTYVSGANATRAALSDNLDAITNKPGIKAVDLIFVTHGLSGSVLFSDTTTSMNNVKNDIVNKLTTAQRAKLRMVFSTACFGSTHSASWLAAGFKVASGSKKIYADSAVSYAPFLVAWANGLSFNTAVAAANAADVGNAVDNAAKVVLFLAGHDNFNNVDSDRIVSGAGSLKISTMP